MALSHDSYIAVIANEPEALEIIKSTLVPSFALKITNSVTAGLKNFAAEKPKLAIISLKLAQSAAEAEKTELRQRLEQDKIPLLLLTCCQSIEASCNCLNSDLVDFLPLPINAFKLQFRVNSLLKLSSAMNLLVKSFSPEQTYGNLKLHPERMAIEIAGEMRPLSVLEAKILQFFLSHQDQIVSRSSLLAAAWDGVRVSERTVDAHIVSLRKKLRGFDHEIRTIYGAGYILEAKVKKLATNFLDRQLG